jgi:hypothetical protein
MHYGEKQGLLQLHLRTMREKIQMLRVPALPQKKRPTACLFF